jgi:hypothetical protein
MPPLQSLRRIRDMQGLAPEEDQTTRCPLCRAGMLFPEDHASPSAAAVTSTASGSPSADDSSQVDSISELLSSLDTDLRSKLAAVRASHAAITARQVVAEQRVARDRAAQLDGGGVTAVSTTQDDGDKCDKAGDNGVKPPSPMRRQRQEHASRQTRGRGRQGRLGSCSKVGQSGAPELGPQAAVGGQHGSRSRVPRGGRMAPHASSGEQNALKEGTHRRGQGRAAARGTRERSSGWMLRPRNGHGDDCLDARPSTEQNDVQA